MVGIKSTPGVFNVQLHLRMTKVNTIKVATCLCVGDSFSEACIIRFASQIFSALEPLIFLT